MEPVLARSVSGPASQSTSWNRSNWHLQFSRRRGRARPPRNAGQSPARVDGESPRTALIHAQVASMTHRFADAKDHLAKAATSTELACCRKSPIIEHRSGLRNQAGSGARGPASDGGRVAGVSRIWCRSEHYSPIFATSTKPTGSISERLREYQDISPFAVAWVCFQLGVLWGELVSEPQLSAADVLVSESHGVFALLCESTRTSGGDLSDVWTW